ncbi:long-chain-fatty-acid-CoA ligase [Paenibacillus pini JCM 16418]|uniref:Long-chain-fatty-acid-CoA ligase n=1 Tax=Paenibacillus pini JCM 16418 TaxID=1236976 RepID=W7YY16_9BACL|nr:long-chain-fatty-acid-CoA ligase [Paenibacillus pini JCM 16418]
MNPAVLLDAYKSGKLSITEVEEQLRQLKQASLRSPLSEGQKGLWALHKMSPGMSAYNLPVCFRVLNSLDVAKFREALQVVQAQFPILSSVVEEDDKGVPYAVVQPSQPLSCSQSDLPGMEPSEIISHVRAKAYEPFQLEQGPLMRTHLFTLPNQETIVLITFHHLIFDGISMLSFLKALLSAYQELVDGRQPRLSSHAASYRDFVEWEQDMLDGKKGAEHLAYWKRQLSGTLPVLEIPSDHPRASAQSFKGRTYTRMLPDQLAEQIKAFSHSYSTNLSIVYLSIFKLLLHRYTQQEDIIVGMPTIGRPEDRFESIIGYFINMIAVRSQLTGTNAFSDLVHDLQMTVADGLDHAAYPFPRLVKELKVERSRANSPLFQTVFMYQNFVQNGGLEDILAVCPALHLALMEEVRQEGEFELALEVYEQGDGIALSFKYDPDCFELSTIERMMTHYIQLAQESMQDPTLPLADYSLLSSNEQIKVVADWNATQADYPKDLCIHECFAEKVRQQLDAVAIILEEKALTYRQLDEKITLLALYLQERGVCPESLVGLCVERSMEMLIGVLGILKAGGAYVALDPNYPDERLKYMLEDSGVAIVLTQSKFKKHLNALIKDDAFTLSLDQEWEEIAEAAKQNVQLKREVRPDHLAYVLYTSGSTGRPKGVMIEHRSIMNTLHFLEARYPVTRQDTYLLKTNYIFDVSISELFGWFIGDGHLVILPPGGEKSPELMARAIEKHRVTHLNFVPAMLNAFLTHVADHKTFSEQNAVKYLMVAGEAFPKELVKKAVDVFKRSRVENIYGPTETSIYATWFSCTQEIITSRHTPIGRPITNTQAYIVDKQLRPVPIGIPGELCIAGYGLARGYFNQPALTAEKFVDNPFQPGTKLYRTGDLTRWLPDGQIEYLGRIDNQVKLRGFRIELGAIETRISGYPGIEDAVAVVKQAGEHKTLVAYYTAREGKTAPVARELRSHLKTGLPDYMVPAHIIRVDRMPLTPSGKIDRKELADWPVTVQQSETQSMPESRVEQAVLAIWEDVLQVGGMGNRDGFFDVGGDSLLAVAVAERIRKELACEFTAMDLFEYPTIQAIASYIAAQQHDDPAALDMVRDEGMEDGGKKDQTRGTREKLDADRVVVELPEAYRDSLAIIGISCEFPGAGNHFEFWNNLLTGKESLKFFTPDELRDLGVPPELAENAGYVPVQSTIAGKDRFDPGFFNLSPKDAGFMDPQLRLLLLHAWKAVEDAGYVAREIPHTSVFMTGSNNGYRALLPEEWTESLETPDGYVSWVLAQSGTIPTMISHKLGLKGPSYFVHANCSSSLVGLYSAYQSLKSGESKYALVGGATLHTGTGVGYVHQAGLNFSTDGHVKAFDASADGMTGGEGAAVLLLKKAADAVADGDHIYALLRGIGLNNDGADKVGFYAPSVKGQADVIRKVLDTTGIDPESISYVEAHGTGTKLGDPIELSALSAVYREHTKRKQYCGIGSVKTNIGHLDTAAGMAGCIKVAMSLYHGELAPTINYKEPNPNMNLENSPFYVVESRKRLEAKEEPYRAALSAFGLGGTNTHAIFEAYRRPNQEEPVSGPYLIPVSAKNQERLRSYAEALLDYLNEGRLAEGRLADLAYTFQVGREAMDIRVAFVAADAAELKGQLENYLQGQGGKRSLGLYTGERKQEGGTLLEDDEDSKTLVRAWITGGRLSKLAEAWCRGMSVDWTLLYSEAKPHRMSAPTYPFAQERYWPRPVQSETPPLTGPSLLHPMLHQNTSVLSEQRFTSNFTGKESFIADHIIQGMAIVPAVVTLEMARAAAEQGLDNAADSDTSIRLRNVVWVRPIEASEERQVQVNVGLYEENGQIVYSMYGEPQPSEADPLLYNQGVVELVTIAEVPHLDLAVIRQQCGQEQLTSGRFYESMLGADYGSSYKGVQAVYMGEDQLLAKLSLPSSAAHTLNSYVLHPSMMDGALQAAEYLQNVTRARHLAEGEAFLAALPFALQELEVIGTCQPDMWVHVRFSEGNKAGETIQKVDIDLCDDLGSVLVRMKGFSTRILDGSSRSDEAADQSSILMLEPVWIEQVVPPDTEVVSYAEQTVVLVESAAELRDSIEAHMKGVRIVVLDHGPGATSERFSIYAEQVFGLIRAAFEQKPQERMLIQIVVTAQDDQQLFTGLTGMLRTARSENSKLIGQLIELQSTVDFNAIPENLEMDKLRPSDIHIRYDKNRRYTADWREAMNVPKDEILSLPWKDGGVYLITGGAGGLGGLFAKEIAHRTTGAVLIIAGRSTQDAKIDSRLEALHGFGARTLYKQVDVTDRDEVFRLIREIRNEFGSLDGILHAAGLIKDSYIIKKTNQELKEVMAPKVTGVIHLDEAIQDDELDFFLLFSSASGSLGSAGQADYAVANTFLDAFAGYRNELVSRKARQGRTLSVIWPLWKDGGMQVDAAIEEMLRQRTGAVPLETSSGMEAVYKAWTLNSDRILVLAGNQRMMRHKLLPAKEEVRTRAVKKGMDTESLENRVRAALREQVSQILQVKKEELDDDTDLTSYGLDSISMTDLTNKLNRSYKLELTPPLFFEYATLRELSVYLAAEHQNVLAVQFASTNRPSASGTTSSVPSDEWRAIEEERPNQILPQRRTRSVFPSAPQERKQHHGASEPIAIIGLSGIFPKAKDEIEYWDNLVSGKDCITEIPKVRWDWRDYYGDPTKEANKTNVIWGGFIDGIAEFDPLFFGISPREAEQMEPQQRLLMTYAWKAVEDAGYSAQSLSGTQTGVFVGTGNTGYGALLAQTQAAIEGAAAANMSPSAGPNRVSYFMNLHGPSEPIDTACSSSLVAIHHAVSAIGDGICDMAIAGGVNTIILPEAYISFDKAGALSKEGKCKAFSDRADGFAHGEGAGMVLLKKLSAAERDGDHIYGVIRGTAVNHGGRSNSLTTPNPKAQSELLQTAYTKAGIDPRTVTYIEAHGTGTSLGDPIEVNGLKSAFQELYRKTGDSEVLGKHCGLGSVKTNIGHLSLAAGVAGVIKILLQLKHKTLAKSLHCDTINPYIQLEGSPFYIVRETQEWKALKDAQGRELPRLAGVSSFGIGGVNAHVVIEEYVPKEEVPAISYQPVALVWSARNEERLQDQARQALQSIVEGRYTDRDLTRIAYTLQVGREAMEERLGILAASMSELKEKLESYLAGKDSLEDVYRGRVDKGAMHTLTADEDIQEAVGKWMQRGKYSKLMEFWVKGLSVDWVKLYGSNHPRRIPLPTYPFAREHYWVEDASKASGSAASQSVTDAWGSTAVLHPLLHRNTSNLMEQRFSSTFTGQEFFLADHVVKGQPILPGVAHLEMAREAVQMALGEMAGTQTAIRLKNIVWIRPIIVEEQPVKVHIGLHLIDDGELSYEVYGQSETADDGLILYSQGSAELSSVCQTPVIELSHLQAACRPSTFTIRDVYETYKRIGFDYGPAFCGVEQIYMGEDFLLATLSLLLKCSIWPIRMCSIRA